jgi:succinoglycan biosynthesis transport protein ExoP
VTVAQYLRLLRRQWTLILTAAFCGALLAAGYAYLQPPTYQASVQLFVSTSNHGTKTSELAEGSTFSQQRVKSYAQLITSSRVLVPVIQRLDLPLTAQQLTKKVRATNPIDTVLIKVTVEDRSPVRARDIANAIAGQFPFLVTQLEASRGASSPVRVSVSEHATLPERPVSPRKNLIMALGLFVGLGAGFGGSLLKQSLDRTITTRAQATEVAGAPVLAAVSEDPTASASPLIVSDAFSPRAESIRQLRTNIRFLSVDQPLRSLVITSALPGEGKTGTASNLAVSMAQNGERVVLIDADLRRPAVADLFGLPSGVGLTTVLIGEVEARDALQPWHPDLPLQVLAAGPVPPNPSELIGSSRMAALVTSLVETGVTVVIDSPPLLPVTDGTILARVTDGALLVTRAGSTQVDQLRAAADGLNTVGASLLGVILNRVPRSGGRNADYSSRYESTILGPSPAPLPTSRPMPPAGGSRATHRSRPAEPRTIQMPADQPGGWAAVNPSPSEPHHRHTPTYPTR